MAKQLVNVIEYNVKTKQQQVVQKEVEISNPRIAEAEHRMQEILMLLQAGDYKTIKYAEGAYSEEEYAPIKAERQALRLEYNALEVELKDIKEYEQN